MRAAAVRAIAKLPGAVERLAKVLETGSVREKQAAVAALATIDGDAADREIIRQIDRMLAGDSIPQPVPPEIRLDVIEAASARKNPSVEAKLEQYLTNGDQTHPLAAYRETLFGGDPALGEQIFRERADVSCMRCHSIRKKGGNAGPDLIGVGKRLSREQILESIIIPGKVIAPGYESVAVRTNDGKTYAGIVKKEDDKILHLIDPGKSDVRVDKSQIKNRRGGMSSMPDNIKDTLSKQDVRNLIEFLSGLTEDAPPKKKPKKDKEAKDAADDDADHGAQTRDTSSLSIGVLPGANL
jgi:quinoprotein glucose dehydrogenase